MLLIKVSVKVNFKYADQHLFFTLDLMGGGVSVFHSHCYIYAVME